MSSADIRHFAGSKRLREQEPWGLNFSKTWLDWIASANLLASDPQCDGHHRRDSWEPKSELSFVLKTEQSWWGGRAAGQSPHGRPSEHWRLDNIPKDLRLTCGKL